MTLKQEIIEILNNDKLGVPTYVESWANQIISLFEKRLPKEIEADNSDDDYVQHMAGGYNQCLKDIKQQLK